MSETPAPRPPGPPPAPTSEVPDRLDSPLPVAAARISLVVVFDQPGRDSTDRLGFAPLYAAQAKTSGDSSQAARGFQRPASRAEDQDSRRHLKIVQALPTGRAFFHEGTYASWRHPSRLFAKPWEIKTMA
jgi:hypothetical protein